MTGETGRPGDGRPGPQNAARDPDDLVDPEDLADAVDPEDTADPEDGDAAEDPEDWDDPDHPTSAPPSLSREPGPADPEALAYVSPEDPAYPGVSEEPERGEAGPGPAPAPGAGCAPLAPYPCWNCGSRVTPPAAACPSCLSPLAHLVLELNTSPALRVTVGPGRELRLGRDPEWAPQTAVPLGLAIGVSRRHATITVDRDGSAWLTDGPAGASLNGTWLNGHRLEPPGSRHRLHDRDALALGLRVRGTVRIHLPPG
ncbi:FHA domain-containing protein [Streptomyces hoynatensis]|uniref:FHA domain-containing protein n=1 Tax=Streptomyces hoynatensis TaxID=1141874 RepID=A0A3A9ZEA2_9ACTN|nr:FHA domain-containing protein [Streptomyces hoynatensis]RKN46690.1 FHA domain-containing protein [Streptomyces hoynatensis]